MAKWILKTSDDEIEQALERARNEAPESKIVEAFYKAGPGADFLMMRLDDGRRLFVPREELVELKNATNEQATDLIIGPHGTDIWWPQLDDGLYLPTFLERRWRKEPQNAPKQAAEDAIAA